MSEFTVGQRVGILLENGKKEGGTVHANNPFVTAKLDMDKYVHVFNPVVGRVCTYHISEIVAR